MKTLSYALLIAALLTTPSCSKDDDDDQTCADVDCADGFICQVDDGLASCVPDPALVVPAFSDLGATLAFDYRPGKWDGKVTWTPCVLYDDGIFKMWYMGSSQNFGTSTEISIGYATSEDGRNWDRHDEPVLAHSTLVPGLGVGAPSVIKDGDLYRMWFVSNFVCPGGCQHRMATSPDGIHWTVEERSVQLLRPAWSLSLAGLVVTGPVIKEDGIYKMWYGVGVDGNAGAGIAYATSADGFEWTPSSTPCIEAGPAGSYDHDDAFFPTVFKHDGTYHMYYWGDEEPGASPQDQTVCYATSADGIQWEKYAFNPVIRPSGWCSDEYHTGSALVLDNTVHLWSAGWLLDSGMKIGYATRDIH